MRPGAEAAAVGRADAAARAHGGRARADPALVHYSWAVRLAGADWAWDKRAHGAFDAAACPPWPPAANGSAGAGLLPRPPEPAALTSEARPALSRPRAPWSTHARRLRAAEQRCRLCCGSPACPPWRQVHREWLATREVSACRAAAHAAALWPACVCARPACRQSPCGQTLMVHLLPGPVRGTEPRVFPVTHAPPRSRPSPAVRRPERGPARAVSAAPRAPVHAPGAPAPGARVSPYVRTLTLTAGAGARVGPAGHRGGGDNERGLLRAAPPPRLPAHARAAARVRAGAAPPAAPPTRLAPPALAGPHPCMHARAWLTVWRHGSLRPAQQHLLHAGTLLIPALCHRLARNLAQRTRGETPCHRAL
jgi:hypothetical protein